MCELFNISSDAPLLKDFRSKETDTNVPCQFKYFGTDGFRGEAGITLTAEMAYKIGRFLGWYYSKNTQNKSKEGHRARIVIGKDTRRSGYMLEYSITAGIVASGADAYMMHVTTTPSISYITRQENFDCGVMITASHNPFYDNGIKIFNHHGEKLDDQTTLLIERYLDGDVSFYDSHRNDLPLANRDKIGVIVDYVTGRNNYIKYLISLSCHSYNNLKIGLDCANGASWSIAKSVFDTLGAKTYMTGNSPDGININYKCGSTHIDNLCNLVKDNNLDVGFAFDGDADRCIAVDSNGNVIDGDKILYILANRFKSHKMLNKDTVVATVMTNMGLYDALASQGISCCITSVGDKNVYQAMQENGYQLGGEQSGHIILKEFATTGDGLLTAIMLTEELKDKQASLSALSEAVNLYPQITSSFKVNDKHLVYNNIEMQSLVERISIQMGNTGRIIMRLSGTEEVIRIMIETKSTAECREYMKIISDFLSNGGFLK